MGYFDTAWVDFFVRYLHVLSAIMWIGLLWYFNFVQIPVAKGLPAELKPAIGKHIAPKALFWFRWSALATIIFGIMLAGRSGYLHDAMTLGLMESGNVQQTAIGVGMWLGLIMAFNVWAIIWPNQKRAIGIVPASDEEKAASARVAMLASRINTALSIPMLYAMVSAQNLY